MAATPAFASTVKCAAGLIPATADTSLTAPTNVTSIVTAGASGSKIEELDFIGVATTVSGLLNVFLYDGTTYHLRDQVLIGAVSVDTVTAAWSASRTYDNLWIPTGWSLRVTGEVVGNQSKVKVVAHYGDY